jgi:hypothetical protein
METIEKESRAFLITEEIRDIDTQIEVNSRATKFYQEYLSNQFWIGSVHKSAVLIRRRLMLDKALNDLVH